MEVFIVYVIKSLVLPPGLMFLMILVGLLVLRKHAILGKSLMITGFGLLVLLSLPIVADFNMNLLQREPVLPESELRYPTAGAIVILGGGRIRNAPEYGHDIPHYRVLQRLRYGAYLQHHTRLPILVTGGVVFNNTDDSEAILMNDVLSNEFRAPATWLEGRSRTTWENAKYSREILKKHGIDTIYLVTTAWHMPRSVLAFESVGFKVVPAPTGYSKQEKKDVTLLSLLPDANALYTNRMFMHELFGILWYKLRYIREK